MATLAGFLIKLGFDVDKDKLAKFKQEQNSIRKGMASIGKAALGVGVAMGAAFLKGTYDMRNMYNVANNNGASITGLKIFASAVSRVGGSAEGAQQAFSEFALKAKTFGPAFEQMVMNQVNVPLRDATGKSRDMAKVMIDISRELQRISKTDPGLARMKAEALGLGAVFDDIVKRDFPKELQRSAQQSEVFGESIEKNAKRSQTLGNEIKAFFSTIGDAALYATAKVTEAFDLDTKMASFNDSFTTFAKSFVDSQVKIMKESSGFFDWISNVFNRTTQEYQKAKIQTIDHKKNRGYASKDELQAQKETKESLAIRRSKSNVESSQEIADGIKKERELRADLAGVDINDKKKVDALMNQKINPDDYRGFDFSKAKEIEEIRTTRQKLANEISAQACSLAEAQLSMALEQRGLVDNVTKNGWSREASARDQAQQVTNSQTSTTDNRSTVVNQNIYISGSNSPVEISRQITQDTKTALMHNSQRRIS